MVLEYNVNLCVFCFLAKTTKIRNVRPILKNRAKNRYSRIYGFVFCCIGECKEPMFQNEALRTDLPSGGKTRALASSALSFRVVFCLPPPWMKLTPGTRSRRLLGAEAHPTAAALLTGVVFA
jgi:hypothetical protein